MAFGAWLTLAVVVAVTYALAREHLAPDLVMFSGLAVLVAAGVVEFHEALAGFGNPALVTIGCLFVVAGAVQETGALKLISGRLLGRAETVRWPLVRLTLPVAGLSAFLNNTPIVALLIPSVRDYAARLERAPSEFLIPLSYAAMLGGTCTLIGTSSNLVVSGLLEQSGRVPLGMLEITGVGLPTAIIGIGYVLTVGHRLLPKRREAVQKAHEQAREYLVEMLVARDSPLVGRTVQRAGLRGLPNLFLAELRRGDQVIRPVAPEDILERGDLLVFTGRASNVRDLRGFPGLKPVEGEEGLEQTLYEVVISHRSPLVGLSVRDAEFRRRYGAAIVAVHRSGERIESKIGDIVLRPGDTLMLSASPGFHAAWQDSTAFYTVSPLPGTQPRRYRRAPIALFVVGLLVLVPTLTGLPMLVAAMVAVVALLVTGCTTPRGVRQSVNWTVLVLIGSAFGVARAMDVSGAAATVAELLVSTAGALGPLGVLAGVYLVTVLFALVIGNAAAAALLFPVAVSAAGAADLAVRPLAIGVAMGASAAFSTPVGYAANLLVYGPGGYRYLDFTKVGLPLNLLCLGVALVAIPWLWPLAG